MLTPQTNPKWSKYSHCVTIWRPTALNKKRIIVERFHLVLWHAEYVGLSSEVSSLLLQKAVVFPYTLPHHTYTEVAVKGFKLDQSWQVTKMHLWLKIVSVRRLKSSSSGRRQQYQRTEKWCCHLRNTLDIWNNIRNERIRRRTGNLCSQTTLI